MFGKFPNTFLIPPGPSLPLLCSLEYNYLEIETCFSKQYMIEYLLLIVIIHIPEFTILNCTMQWF